MPIEKRCDSCVHWNSEIPERPAVSKGHGLCDASGDTPQMKNRMVAPTAVAYPKDNKYGNEHAYFETAPWHSCLMWIRKPRTPKIT
jgi:hypothetical protein